MALRAPVSFEFYPPKTDEQRAQLDRSVQRLKAHAPQFMSVTFGAGGSTLSHTPETVQRLRSEHGVAGVPHITCVGGSREEIRSLLKLYRALGCDRVVALRGDTPSGMARSGDLRYASELVALIRAEHGDHFQVEVAAYPETHPQAEDAHADLRNFKRARSGSTSRSCRGSCRSPISASSGVFPKPAARRSRAGSASACAPMATMPTASASSRRTAWPGCAGGCLPAVRHRCTSIPSTWPSRP